MICIVDLYYVAAVAKDMSLMHSCFENTVVSLNHCE